MSSVPTVVAHSRRRILVRPLGWTHLPYLIAAAAWGILVIAPSEIGHHAAASPSWGVTFSWWMTMLVAMTAPLMTPRMRAVLRNGLRRRRGRTLLCYYAGFLAPWALYAATLASLLPTLDRSRPATHALPVVAAVAALWQSTPLRRSIARRCGTPALFPLDGWRSVGGCTRLGMRDATTCVGLCWASMLMMIPLAHPGYMAALMGAHLYEVRRGPNPFLEQRWKTPALIYAAVTAGSLVVLMSNSMAHGH